MRVATVFGSEFPVHEKPVECRKAKDCQHIVTPEK
jgi:hypothetical protein